MRANRKGMTFIEIMLVVLLIGILASIAILTMSYTRKHAIALEAIVGISSLKQAMRYYYAEYRAYQNLNGFLDPDTGANYPQGINPHFLDGRYFRDKCYRIETSDVLVSRIMCFPLKSDDAQGKSIAEGGEGDSYIWLELEGPNFYQQKVPCTGYKNGLAS